MDSAEARNGVAPPVKKKRKKAKRRSSWMRLLVNSLAVVPSLIFIYLRAGDSFLHDDSLCERFGAGSVLVGAVSAGLALIKASSLRPLPSSIFSVALFAAIKQRADSIPAPPVSRRGDGALAGNGVGQDPPMVALVTGANSGIGCVKADSSGRAAPSARLLQRPTPAHPTPPLRWIRFAVSLELVRQGHCVLMACRSAERCDAARSRLLDELADDSAAMAAARRLLPPSFEEETAESSDLDDVDGSEDDDEAEDWGGDGGEDISEDESAKGRGEEEKRLLAEAVARAVAAAQAKAQAAGVAPPSARSVARAATYRFKMRRQRAAEALAKAMKAKRAGALADRVASVGGLNLARSVVAQQSWSHCNGGVLYYSVMMAAADPGDPLSLQHQGGSRLRLGASRRRRRCRGRLDRVWVVWDWPSQGSFH